MNGIKIMERPHKRGAFIKVLDRPGLDLTTPTAQGILALLSGLAQQERERIVKRANDGRTAAKKRDTKSAASASSDEGSPTAPRGRR
jgi:DNA invertase Pin-like site-specific DNA recombinase